MNATAWVLLITAVLLIAYDVFAAATWGRDHTISREVLFAAGKYPIIAFAAGVLCGHLFWPQR